MTWARRAPDNAELVVIKTHFAAIRMLFDWLVTGPQDMIPDIDFENRDR